MRTFRLMMQLTSARREPFLTVLSRFWKHIVLLDLFTYLFIFINKNITSNPLGTRVSFVEVL